ncbi:MAG: DUF3618 domain-containing protein, partial [Actinomycetota bacterium]|nr:DUF3618 domain-containing protein [Actinomycetota bacterium]
MATDANEVRREIAQARNELGETLEAIGDRVAPKKVVARAKDNVAEKVDDVRDKVSPSRLLRRPGDALRRGLQSLVGGSESDSRADNGRVSSAGRSARSQTREVTGRAGTAASRAGDRVSSAASRAGDRTRGAA